MRLLSILSELILSLVVLLHSKKKTKIEMDEENALGVIVAEAQEAQLVKEIPSMSFLMIELYEMSTEIGVIVGPAILREKDTDLRRLIRSSYLLAAERVEEIVIASGRGIVDAVMPGREKLLGIPTMLIGPANAGNAQIVAESVVVNEAAGVEKLGARAVEKIEETAAVTEKTAEVGESAEVTKVLKNLEVTRREFGDRWMEEEEFVFTVAILLFCKTICEIRTNDTLFYVCIHA
jgi:hypothetical protein